MFLSVIEAEYLMTSSNAFFLNKAKLIRARASFHKEDESLCKNGETLLSAKDINCKWLALRNSNLRVTH
jgi:hypothetical protein